MAFNEHAMMHIKDNVCFIFFFFVIMTQNYRHMVAADFNKC
jgi:hypothetical protein